ncbi:phosphoenolpyruvate carboxykinase (ATP) [Erysipelothrix aquatica]|uniref:phosphoenolpyruvate carboxykinase (ATP) n=1 Tax=Erysipelothrix aquatica TaxID=2683714 RepID=UPI00135BBF47|nr:phosphoenolpyruvate carboxykinase (ATP) [Erysipelothrix aquatica]
MFHKHVHQAFKSTVETAFYHNHVIPVKTREAAYRMSETAPATIVTDLVVNHTEALGLPQNAKVLVDNNGSVVGRTARARHIIDSPKDMAFVKLVQDIIANNHNRPFYSSCVYVGLDDDFQMNVHIMIPQGHENNLYNTMMNFEAGCIENPKGEQFIYVDPDWRHPDYPQGLVLLDPHEDVAVILGLNYFGEIKKAILSLAWNAAKRYNYIPCHGGLKYMKDGEHEQVMAAFGLSGSGKSTITFAQPKATTEVKVLHDDAFIIHEETKRAIALEPSYFDKTADYPMGHDAIEAFITVQNNGVVRDDSGKLVLKTEDIRNGNGRTIKSKYWTDNRIDAIDTPLKTVFWIMRDDAFPPCVRLDDPVLAAVMGATISTTRSNAENTDEVGKLVIEPYANPFRLYPLLEDYTQFKSLFESEDVTGYILNTGYFNGDKIKPEDTMKVIHDILTDTVVFQPFGPLPKMSYAVSDAFTPDFDNVDYLEKLRRTFTLREKYLLDADEWHWLPKETYSIIKNILQEIH